MAAITHNQLLSMTAKALRNFVSDLRQQVGGRYINVKYQQSKLGHSQAIDYIDYSGGLPSTRIKYRDNTGKIRTRYRTRNELISEARRAMVFLDMDTSTVAGMRARRNYTISKILGDTENLSDEQRAAMKKFVLGRDPGAKVSRTRDLVASFKRVIKGDELSEFWRHFNKFKSEYASKPSDTLLQMMRQEYINNGSELDYEQILANAIKTADETFAGEDDDSVFDTIQRNYRD